MSALTEGLDKKQKMQWLISIALAVCIMMIPTGAAFSAPLRLFIAGTSFFILLIAFDLLPLFVASMLLPAFWIVSGIPVGTAFAGFTNNTFPLVIGALVLTNALEEAGFLKRICLVIVKAMSGSFNRLLYAVYIIGVLMAFLASNNGHTIAIAFTYGICVALGLKMGEQAALLMASVSFANITAKLFIYNPNYLSIAQSGIQQYVPDFTIGFLDMLFWNWPLILVNLFMIFLMTKITNSSKYNIDGAKEYFENEFNQMGKMSAKEWKGAILLTMLIAYLIFNPYLHKPLFWGFLIIPYLFFLPGINVATSQSIKKLNFGLIFFIPVCLSIGNVATFLGFSDILKEFVVPLLGNTSYFTLMVVAALIAGASNFILTPLAILTIFTGPFVGIAVGMGFEPLGIVMAFIEGCNIIFAPHETAFVLILFGFGMMSMKDFVKWHAYCSVLCFIGYFALCVPWHMFLGLY